MKILSIFFLVTALVGCAAHPSAPSNAPSPLQEPALESSTIDLPLTLNLQRVRVQLLQQLPHPLAQGSAALQGPLGMTVIARHRISVADIGLRVYGQEYRVVVDVRFALQADLGHGVVVGCSPAAPGRARFILQGRLDTVQGHLQARAQTWQVQWLQSCQLAPLAVNLDQVLSLPLLRERIKAEVDAALADALGPQGLAAAIAGVWPELNQPLPLGQGLWLLLHPQALALGEVKGEGVLLHLRLQLQARPEVLGQRPDRQPLPAMPPLSPLAPAQGVHLALRIDLPLDRADALLDASVANRPWVVGQHRFELSALRTYGHADQAVLSLDLLQPFQGRVDLYAQTHLDVKAGTLSFIDPDYTLDSRSALARSASWMLSHKVRQALAQNLKLRFSDVPSMLSRYTRTTQSFSWAGGSIAVRLRLDDVQVRFVGYTATALHALIVADGHIDVSDD